MPVTRSILIRVTNPDGGLSPGGNTTSGPRYFFASGRRDVRRPALRDRGAAMHDEIGLEPAWVYRTRKHRQCHPVVSTDVMHLAALGLVANDDLVTVDSDPHEADLWPPVRVNGHEVDQRR